MRGVGEVTAAIMLTATFAVAAAILYGVFQENVGTAQTMLHTRYDADRRQAAELIGIGPKQCGAGVLLYNYGHTPIHLDHVVFYDSAGYIISGTVFRDLDGNTIRTLPARDATWLDTSAVPCNTVIIMVTPAGQLIKIMV